MRRHSFIVSFVVGLCIFLIGGTSGVGFHAPSAYASPNVYYVAKTGNDKNPGTVNKPWKNLQHAADVVKPGSVVYVRKGVYHQKLKITRSGSKADGPITFASYPSEKAVLDGKGLSVGDEDEGLIDIHDASYIKIKGFDIQNFTTSKRGHVPVGILVHGSGSHISLLNNKVHAIKNTANPDSDLNGRDAHGIAVYGTKAPASLNHIVIKSNELYNLVLGSSESLVVNGNVDTFSIIDNTIHDNDNIGIDAIGFEGTSPDPAYDRARNGKIVGNKVYNISSNNNPSYGLELPNDSNGADGVYVDGGKDSMIERNYIYKNDIGIEIASEHKGKATSNISLRHNLIYKNRWTGIAMGGYDTKRGSTVNSKIENNTLYKNGTLDEGGPQMAIQYDTENNTIKQNVMIAGKSNVLIENKYVKNIGNTVDHNLYSAPGGSGKAKWFWKKKRYDGFSQYKNETGNDTHSSFIPPKLVNASSNKNLWYIDEGAPEADLGQEGDLYWNTKNDNVYKKISNGWAEIINLKKLKGKEHTMVNKGSGNNNGSMNNGHATHNIGKNNNSIGTHASDDSGQGGLLPVTASRFPTMILVGLLMVVFGGLLLYRRKKSLD